MEDLLDRFDALLLDNVDAPAAISLTENYQPVGEREFRLVFPPTFAGPQADAGQAGEAIYNIDELPDGHSVCLLDSVGSQANRMEPAFGRAPLSELVPQVQIEAGGVTVSLLEVGHRLADASVRFSDHAEDVKRCWDAVAQGNAEPMAKLAPTTLVFGAWDSRGTTVKLPRLISSTIYAFDVTPVKRSATYIPPVPYEDLGLLPKVNSGTLAKAGFDHQPITRKLGGVVAAGPIVRVIDINLVALRALESTDPDSTIRLRRYIFGIVLASLTVPMTWLRQGTILRRDPEVGAKGTIYWANGSVSPWPSGTECWVDAGEQFVAYARAAADSFGVGGPKTIQFSKELAQQGLGETSVNRSAGRSGSRGRGKKAGG